MSLEHYAHDPRSGDLVRIPEDALIQYEAWGITRETGIKLYAAGFTPNVLYPFLNRANPLIASGELANHPFFKTPVSAIPTPRRRKARRQLKPLKPYQMKG